MSNQRRFAFILNPKAGRGKALKFEKRLLDYVRERNLKFTFERTREPLHATELAANASKEFDVVVAMGGDGTVHEVANGVAGTPASMGVLPVGSGNDFNRMVGMPKNFEQAIESLVKGPARVFDSGHLTYTDDGNHKTRHFINSLGIGLDAIVAYQARQITWLRGLPLYLAAVLNTLRHLESYALDITVDGWQKSKQSFVLCIGNGMFEGGGFKLTPGANPYDDKFEVCLIEEMSLKSALTVVPKLITGQHGDHPKVTLFDTRKVTVTTTTPFVMHADGEILGKRVSNISAEVRAGAVSVIVPA